MTVSAVQDSLCVDVHYSKGIRVRGSNQRNVDLTTEQSEAETRLEGPLSVRARNKVTE
jgi:hypothetical protein